MDGRGGVTWSLGSHFSRSFGGAGAFLFHFFLLGAAPLRSSRVRHNSSAVSVVVRFFLLSRHFVRIVTHGICVQLLGGPASSVTSICVSNDGTVNLSRRPSLCERSVCGQCPA